MLMYADDDGEKSNFPSSSSVQFGKMGIKREKPKRIVQLKKETKNMWLVIIILSDTVYTS